MTWCAPPPDPRMRLAHVFTHPTSVLNPPPFTQVHFKRSANVHPLGVEKSVVEPRKPGEVWENPIAHPVWSNEEVSALSHLAFPSHAPSGPDCLAPSPVQ